MTSKRKDLKIKRSTADRLANEVQERIFEINENPDFAFVIGRAVIFGSYVNTDSDMISDLDIGIEIRERFEDKEKQKEISDKRIAAYYSEGHGQDFLMSLYWPIEEITRYLKHRSGYISIHDIRYDKIAVFSSKTIELNTTRTEGSQ